MKSILRRFAPRRPERANRCAARRLGFEQCEARLAPATFTSTDVPQQIPDIGQVTSVMSVEESFVVSDVDVEVEIQHGANAELRVYLLGPESPGSRQVRVQLFTDVSGSDIRGAVLDDEAEEDIALGTAPYSGRYRPDGSLASLDGIDAAGDWSLVVFDDHRGGLGTLQSWSLIFSGGPQAQNAENRFDVNDDGQLTMADLLDQVSDLRTNGTRSLQGDAPHALVDVNGDGMASIADLLELLNALRQKMGSAGSSQPEGESSAMQDDFSSVWLEPDDEWDQVVHSLATNAASPFYSAKD